MAVSVSILATIISFHLISFVLAIGRRSSAKAVPDKYDERTYCVYGTDASTLRHWVCLLDKGLLSGSSSTGCAIFFFVFSWISFLGAEACLIAGSARNAYHTKYSGYFGVNDISCATLHKELILLDGRSTTMKVLA
ncbi:hypothetical protein K2173_000256 [Erythroxylum novogranatense]|uniref:Uncharacterized protein n=1 Tax=Erythroxylum novogranatense TaxID=1862640 RepID=A0AAV8SWZ6_9ROSI|nr:hypothetical protein K2173_000256 [Erythroxylum novogranatense]